MAPRQRASSSAKRPATRARVRAGDTRVAPVGHARSAGQRRQRWAACVDRLPRPRRGRRGAGTRRPRSTRPHAAAPCAARAEPRPLRPKWPSARRPIRARGFDGRPPSPTPSAAPSTVRRRTDQVCALPRRRQWQAVRARVRRVRAIGTSQRARRRSNAPHPARRRPRCPAREGAECRWYFRAARQARHLRRTVPVLLLRRLSRRWRRRRTVLGPRHERKVTDELKKCFPKYNWVFDQTLRIAPLLCTRHRPGRALQAPRSRRHRRGRRALTPHLPLFKEREQSLSPKPQSDRDHDPLQPDAYTDYADKRIPSCFTAATKDNQTVHVPETKGQWKRRPAELVRTIETLADPEFELPPKQEDRPSSSVSSFTTTSMRRPRTSASPPPSRPTRRPIGASASGRARQAGQAGPASCL